MTNSEEWVLDVSVGEPYSFCPFEESGSVVVGLSFISDKCPGKLVGVFHAGGADAVEAWIAENPNWYQIYSE